MGRLLPRCKHFYHTECILPWLTQRQGCCPMCKTPVLPEDMQSTRSRRSPRRRLSHQPQSTVVQQIPVISPSEVDDGLALGTPITADMNIRNDEYGSDLESGLRIVTPPNSPAQDILEDTHQQSYQY